MKTFAQFMIILWIVLIGLLFTSGAMAQPTFHLSGGGSGLIYNTIQSATTTGGTIIIDDSLAYTETQDLLVGQRYNSTDGKRAFNIEAALGQNPTIVMSGNRFVFYSGSADLHIGSASGGRIYINATAANGDTIWFIGQANGYIGQACQALFENLDIDFRTNYTQWTGSNITMSFIFDITATDPTLTFRDVVGKGGWLILRDLFFHPTEINYKTTVTFDNCEFYDWKETGIEVGQWGYSGPNTTVNLIRTVMYQSPSAPIGNEANLVAGLWKEATAPVGCQIYIDHCDLINECNPSQVPIQRGIISTDGNIYITNTIARADWNLINWGSGNICAATDSNITGISSANIGFATSDTIEEWPVYVFHTTNPSQPRNFQVMWGTQSATHGTSPPLGSVGVVDAQSGLENWRLYR